MPTADKSQHQNGNVHFILAHSYVVYFVLLLIGVYLDLIFKFKIFTNSIMVPLGAGILMFATFLILWAQKTGLDLRNVREVKTEHFCRGPYCYTRSPTHLGLFLLMLGFGIMVNAFFVILFTFISYFISKFIFVDREEKILTQKYGTPYMEYKKIVRF